MSLQPANWFMALATNKVRTANFALDPLFHFFTRYKAFFTSAALKRWSAKRPALPKSLLRAGYQGYELGPHLIETFQNTSASHLFFSHHNLLGWAYLWKSDCIIVATCQKWPNWGGDNLSRSNPVSRSASWNPLRRGNLDVNLACAQNSSDLLQYKSRKIELVASCSIY
jgi:hypothetical protein